MALGRGLGALIPNFKAPTDGDNPPTIQPPQSGANRPNEIRAQTKEGNVWYVPVSLIKANAYQPRQQFDHADLEDLINSIKESLNSS